MSHGGKREGAGRKPGAVSKKNIELQEKLAEMGCDPIIGMAKIAEKALNGIKKFTDKGVPYTEIDYELAGKMYNQIAPYTAPKLSAVQLSGTDGEDVKISATVNFVGK